MKKLILFLLIYQTCLSQTWASLSSNQIPNWTSYQTSGFSLNAGQSAITSNQCPTKDEVLSKYNVSISTGVGNQLIAKGNISAGVTYFAYFDEGDCSYVGNPTTRFYSPQIAAAGGDGSTYVMALGDEYYYDSSYTQPIDLCEVGGGYIRIKVAGTLLNQTGYYDNECLERIDGVTSCTAGDYKFYNYARANTPCTSQTYEIYFRNSNSKYYYWDGSNYFEMYSLSESESWYIPIEASTGGTWDWLTVTVNNTSTTLTLGPTVNSPCAPF